MTDHDPLAHAWGQDWHTHARAEAAPVSGGYNASLPAAGITTAPRQETHTMPARLDEDEAAARRASPGPWQYGDVDSVAGGSLYDTTRMIGSVHYEQATDHDGTVVRHLLSPEADANGEHLARWDPSRVLAEIAVKREVLAEAADHGPCTYTGSAMTCLHCWLVYKWAAIHADHPDYQQEWTP